MNRSADLSKDGRKFLRPFFLCWRRQAGGLASIHRKAVSFPYVHLRCCHRLFFLGWFLLILAPRLWSDENSLIRVNDTWRYRPATNETTALGTNWLQQSFDDGVWAEGESGFATNFREATNLSLPPGCGAVYFRRLFTVFHPDEIVWLTLRVNYAHGFVAYLNGQEIARRNLTNDPVTSDSLATWHPAGTAEEIDVSAAAGALTTGSNILAVQVHAAAASNELTFNAELLANFQRGPFIQNVSTSSAQIIWHTPIPADGTVEFGESAALDQRLADGMLTNRHVMTLTNLRPDTAYSYRVRSSKGTAQAASATLAFRTMRAGGALTFVVLGDTHSGNQASHRLAGVIAASEADLVVHVGDIVYNEFTFGRADLGCLSLFKPHMQRVPYFFAAGNHDVMSSQGAAPFLESFYLPTNNVTGTEHFYSFDQGDAHFVVLYAPTFARYPASLGYELTNESPQFQWLTNDLTHSAKPWKFIFIHAPIRTSGYHRNDDENSNNLYDPAELEDLLLPVARRYGVQVCFSGHDHGYERLGPVQGAHLIVSGGGGAGLYPMTERDPASVQWYARHHFVKVTIQGDALRLEAVDDNGVVFDSMSLQRAMPAPQTWEAAWNSPVVESEATTDGHGNIDGQVFDFVGVPIPAVAGDISNLGRAYVNHDGTNVYVGIDQAMLSGQQCLFLFIESPLQTGATNLASLGNGIIDPEQQGVDGLDFLKNLSFSNFTPSIAVLAGDEYADGTSRSFARPALALNVGQGVYSLDPSFSSVAGARLQQFNRSPQVLESTNARFYQLFGERTANFIEVAIPAAALGHPRPGDVLKLAAIVAGPDFDTNPSAFAVDRGFLGASLTGSGFAQVVLEGWPVRLASPPPGGDEDGDGLLNGWELAHALDPFSAWGDDGAGSDPDHDGASNSEEQVAGTHPLNTSSALRVMISSHPGGRIRLFWFAVGGKKYQLEYREAGEDFQDHPDVSFPRTAVSNLEFFEDTLPSAVSPCRTYRLRILP